MTKNMASGWFTNVRLGWTESNKHTSLLQCVITAAKDIKYRPTEIILMDLVLIISENILKAFFKSPIRSLSLWHIDTKLFTTIM